MAAAPVSRSLFFPGVAPALQRRALQLPLPAKAKEFIAHPAGPFTIHFWAPTLKWGISLANLMDLRDKGVETVSPAQQTAVAATGLIWSRYSMVIKPKNWNLFSVNVVMAITGCIQLTRIAYAKLSSSSRTSSSSKASGLMSNPDSSGSSKESAIMSTPEGSSSSSKESSSSTKESSSSNTATALKDQAGAALRRVSN